MLLVRCNHVRETLNVKKYVKNLNSKNKSVVISTGPAGTGKTMLACKYSMEQLQKYKYDKLIITRPNVSVDEDLGYLPGDVHGKMYPWLIPIYDHIIKFSDKKTLDNYMMQNTIEITPLGFLRGRTFDNSIIIADEMQNSTPSQMKTLLTRVGNNSKLIINGDLKQCDLKTTDVNGLQDFIEKFQMYEKSSFEDSGISITEFMDEDIFRSEIVKYILKVYNQEK
jgi:phosphate starvation-inducible protein PhoH and related proteins